MGKHLSSAKSNLNLISNEDDQEVKQEEEIEIFHRLQITCYVTETARVSCGISVSPIAGKLEGGYSNAALWKDTEMFQICRNFGS